MLKAVGRGGDVNQNKNVAIKQMLNSREGSGIPQDAYREIKILKELQHENIVKLERVFLRPDKHQIDLVYDFAEHDLTVCKQQIQLLPCDLHDLKCIDNASLLFLGCCMYICCVVIGDDPSFSW